MLLLKRPQLLGVLVLGLLFLLAAPALEVQQLDVLLMLQRQPLVAVCALD
jgi:hypothetical protein